MESIWIVSQSQTTDISIINGFITLSPHKTVWSKHIIEKEKWDKSFENDLEKLYDSSNAMNKDYWMKKKTVENKIDRAFIRDLSISQHPYPLPDKVLRRDIHNSGWQLICCNIHKYLSPYAEQYSMSFRDFAICHYYNSKYDCLYVWLFNYVFEYIFNSWVFIKYMELIFKFVSFLSFIYSQFNLHCGSFQNQHFLKFEV